MAKVGSHDYNTQPNDVGRDPHVIRHNLLPKIGIPMLQH